MKTSMAVILYQLTLGFVFLQLVGCGEDKEESDFERMMRERDEKREKTEFKIPKYDQNAAPSGAPLDSPPVNDPEDENKFPSAPATQPSKFDEILRKMEKDFKARNDNLSLPKAPPREPTIFSGESTPETLKSLETITAGLNPISNVEFICTDLSKFKDLSSPRAESILLHQLFIANRNKDRSKVETLTTLLEDHETKARKNSNLVQIERELEKVSNDLNTKKVPASKPASALGGIDQVEAEELENGLAKIAPNTSAGQLLESAKKHASASPSDRLLDRLQYIGLQYAPLSPRGYKWPSEWDKVYSVFYRGTAPVLVLTHKTSECEIEESFLIHSGNSESNEQNEIFPLRVSLSAYFIKMKSHNLNGCSKFSGEVDLFREPIDLNINRTSTGPTNDIESDNPGRYSYILTGDLVDQYLCSGK